MPGTVHELDKKGKDSHLHREAGASPTAIISDNLTAVFMPNTTGEDPLERILHLYKESDFIIIEGYLNGPGKKIEVWRKETGTRPISSQRDDIKAVITDDLIDTVIPVWPRHNIVKIADHICAIAGINGYKDNSCPHP